MFRMICRGLNCNSGNLIEAHIIPQAFGRLIRGPDANVKVTSAKVRQANPQLGEYDANILCEKCDNWLGKNDEYAVDVCRSFNAGQFLRDGDVFGMESVDCERFSKFVLSVLWRASISLRPSFAPVKLGPYEDVVRDILLLSDCGRLSGTTTPELHGFSRRPAF
jgi:hypothetical protein